MTKQELYDIVDTRLYITTNCFQHQLTEVLDRTFSVIRVELSELLLGRISFPDNAIVLSRLKLRSLFNNLEKIAPFVQKTRFFVYEQDTWENFLVDSPYFGSYKTICSKTPVISFFNMSHWWSDLVNTCGIPSKFIQVWMLPQYCSSPVPWSQRKHDVIFCGTMYPHRQMFFEKLKAEGVNIDIVPAGKDYGSYLNLLSNSKIAIRTEMINWKIDSGHGPYVVNYPNAQWQRDIECAARGCVSMRERDGEADLWGIDHIPTIRPFVDVKDAAESIRQVLAIDNDVMNMRINRSLEIVKEGIGWNSVPNAIFESLGVT